MSVQAFVGGQWVTVADVYPLPVLTPTAGYTPVVKDVVEMNFDGTLRKGIRAVKTVLASGSTVPAARVAAVDATHCVVLWSAGTALNAQVWAVDPASGIPSAVAAAQLVVTLGAAHNSWDIGPVDATHVLVGYATTVGGQLSVRTLTINVTTGAITVNAAVNGGATAGSVTLYPVPGSTNNLMLYSTSGTNITAAIVSVSVTVPTINGLKTLTTGATTLVGHIGVTVTGDGLFCAFGYNVTTTPFNAHIAYCTITGTTLGTIADLDTGLAGAAQSTQISLQIEEGPPASFVAYVSQTIAGAAQPLSTGFMFPRKSSSTSLGTNAGWGTPKHFMPTSSEPLMRAVDKANGVFFMIIMNDPYVDAAISKGHLFFMKRKGGPASMFAEFDYGDDYLVSSGAQLTGTCSQGACTLSSGWVMAAICMNVASQAYVVAIKRRNRVLGIAVDTLGTVQRSGLFVTTGLTAGAEYFADDGGNLTTTPGECHIGYAIDSTHLLLDVRSGL